MMARGTSNELAVSALLITEDQELAAQLHLVLPEGRVFELLAELKRYPQEHTLEIRLRQLQPDVVLLDLGSSFQTAAQLIRVVGAFQPPIQVVGLSRTNDPSILIDSLRAGASEFLYAPFDVSAQREAAARIRRLREPERSEPQEFGRLVAFTAAKPGSGSSTLATQTAFCLRRLTGKRVLLADLDVLSGSIAFALKLNPTHSLLDALQNSGRLDASLLSSFTLSCSGVDVLAAPDVASSDTVEFSRLHDVLEHSRVLYDWIVVDLPAVFHRLSLFVLSEADQSLLVSTSELPSLHLARRAVSMLGELGYGRERFQMIVNRLNRKDHISAADMEKILACAVFACFPNDYYALHKAVTRAEPLSANCELGRALEQFTTRVVGLAGLAGKEKRMVAGIAEQKPVFSEG